MRFNIKGCNLIYFSTSLFLLSLVFTACSSESTDEIEQTIDVNEVEENNDDCTSGKLFIEKNGLVKVDIENPSASANGWVSSKVLAGYVGDDYLIWTGNDNFNTPGNGLMRFTVKINTPGTYQFVWSSRIGVGTSNTEHNDSWLRIKGDDFFGEKASTGDRVYPKGSGKTPNPEGSSADGWLKVYMNRLDEWFWRSSTNDKDPFDVFVTFQNAGNYDVEISGRSKSHALDQFVLFKTDKTLSQAQNIAFSEITCK